MLAVVILLACACEPEATPLPVNLPTREPPTLAPTEPGLLRYALAPETLPYLSEQDRTAISADAEIVELDTAPNPDDLGTRYDIVVTLGVLPDAETAPSPLTLSLIVNTTLPPLDNPSLTEIVRTVILSAADQTELRRDLANAGYPDGFDLTLAAFAPGADSLAALLDSVNIQIRIINTANEPAHLTLTTQPTTDAITLQTIPIHYRAVDGLTITFAPSGFPIARR